MAKAAWIAAVVVGLVLVALVGLTVWWVRGWKHKAMAESADNTLQDISDKYEKVSDEMANDTDAEAWKRHQENIDSRRR